MIAEAAAAAWMAAVLIVSEWAKDRPEIYVEWEKRNTALLEKAGAPLAIGSNAYGSPHLPGALKEPNPVGPGTRPRRPPPFSPVLAASGCRAKSRCTSRRCLRGGSAKPDWWP